MSGENGRDGGESGRTASDLMRAHGARAARPDDSDVILERLLTLHPKSIDLSLNRVHRLLGAVGHPERRLPPVIHVAGTNGKGSVCAYLRAGLEAAGGRAHVYSSPHLTRFHERIRLAGALIDEAALSEILAECEAANGDAPITYFEITTVAAFLAFARAPAEWCVLEVGLGGRLDATNVVDAPKATVITPVSLDHREFLGDTIAAIAAEKAGILKPGVPGVIAPQLPEAMAAIEAAAERVGAPLLRAGEDWTCRAENDRLVFEDGDGLLDLPAPALTGRHQVDNAGAAIATLRLLGAAEEACAASLRDATWPARLQRLRRGPLTDLAPPSAELWLDGGHNPAAGAALAAYFGELEETSPARLFVICGMMGNKDHRAFLAPFQGLARKVYGVPIPGEENAATATDVASAAVAAGLTAQAVGSPEGALRNIAAELEFDMEEPVPRVLICGSLHLAGRILSENG